MITDGRLGAVKRTVDLAAVHVAVRQQAQNAEARFITQDFQNGNGSLETVQNIAASSLDRNLSISILFYIMPPYVSIDPVHIAGDCGVTDEAEHAIISLYYGQEAAE